MIPKLSLKFQAKNFIEAKKNIEGRKEERKEGAIDIFGEEGSLRRMSLLAVEELRPNNLALTSKKFSFEIRVLNGRGSFVCRM